MWIDGLDADRRIARIKNRYVRNAVSDISQKGLHIMKGVVPNRLCNAVISDFQKFCNDNPAEAKFAEFEGGLHSRLYNLHCISRNCLELALLPHIVRILDEIFSNRAALNSTLYFEQGSEQPIHRDTPFFTAIPYAGEFVGVWFALEDVKEEAGALTYIPGGHKYSVDIEASRSAFDADPVKVDKMFKHYCSQVIKQAAEDSLDSQVMLLKKGDVAIWHPELPHGGGAIRRPGISRNSVVAHYIPERAYIQTVGFFFGVEEEKKIMEFVPAVLPPGKLSKYISPLLGRVNRKSMNDRLMRWNEKPVFMPNS